MPLTALHGEAVAAIRGRPADESIAVACSGGADSVALLLMLWAHLPERRGRWLVLHFDHRLRGRASTEDARFVARLARSLGESCVVGRWTDPPTAPSEADARGARWTFLETAMETAGARVIALGHQLNDVAESLLMRLARGSGVGGLSAPRPVQCIQQNGTMRVRPLLACPARLLRAALRRARIAWREDATNATDQHVRNRVRRRVLPALASATGRDALVAMGESRALLAADDEALERWLDELVGAPDPVRPFDLSSLRGRPVALARRAVHRWINAVGLTEAPGRTAVAALAAAIVAGREQRLSAGPGRFIDLKARCLCLADESVLAGSEAPWPADRLEPGQELIGPRGDRLRARVVRLTPSLLACIRSGAFPPSETVHISPGTAWSGWFDIRGWRPGDRFRPLGAPGRKKLQDMFVDRRVPRELRPLLPVVSTAAGNVVWVPGLPPADEVGIQPTAKLVVQLTYAPAPPMVHRPIDPTFQDVRLRKAKEAPAG